MREQEIAIRWCSHLYRVYDPTQGMMVHMGAGLQT